MKRRQSNLVLFLVTGVSALAAVLMSYGYLEKRLEQERARTTASLVDIVEEPDLRAVVVAQRDVFRGETLKPEDLTVLRVPVEGVTVKGVITDPRQAIGHLVLQPLYAGEWLLDRKLSTADQAGGLEALVGPGRRAMRVPVDEVSGLLGVLEPGSRVDLIGVFASSDGKRMIGRTLVQNVPVLAVGRRSLPAHAEPSADKKESGSTKENSTVTLDVSMREAEEIALALQVGKIHLALRQGMDLEMVSTEGVNVRTLETAGTPPSTAPTRPARHVIEVLHGDRVQKEVVNR